MPQATGSALQASLQRAAEAQAAVQDAAVQAGQDVKAARQEAEPEPEPQAQDSTEAPA